MSGFFVFGTGSCSSLPQRRHHLGRWSCDDACGHSWKLRWWSWRKWRRSRGSWVKIGLLHHFVTLAAQECWLWNSNSISLDNCWWGLTLLWNELPWFREVLQFAECLGGNDQGNLRIPKQFDYKLGSSKMGTPFVEKFPEVSKLFRGYWTGSFPEGKWKLSSETLEDS